MNMDIFTESAVESSDLAWLEAIGFHVAQSLDISTDRHLVKWIEYYELTIAEYLQYKLMPERLYIKILVKGTEH